MVQMLFPGSVRSEKSEKLFICLLFIYRISEHGMEGRARSPSLPGNTRLSAIQIQRKNGRKRQNLGRNFESP